MKFSPFHMERWQSTYEHRVDFNLTESGVHPLTAAELFALAGAPPDLGAVRLGYGQSNGSDELRALIASQYDGATDGAVVVTTGGSEANFASFWQRAGAGKPLAAMVPNYMQVPGLESTLGTKVLPFELREEDGWRPDLGQLAEALAAGARTILVTNPNNPTGKTLTEGEMAEIARLADRHGAWILADEVYRGAEVEAGAETTPTFWGRCDRVLVTNSLSKAYGLPGVRIGWIVAPDEVVEELWARTDYTTIAPASLSDTLACVALSPEVRPRVLERTRGIIRNNLGVLAGWLDARSDLFAYAPPDAGAICMVRYRHGPSSLELAEQLRVEQGLLVVPGAHFGVESSIRLGFGLPEEELLGALERLERAFVQAAA